MWNLKVNLPISFFNHLKINMFDPNWLQERYRFDEEARNKQLEWTCVNQFAFRDHLQIVDLGSGTGANLRYYLEQFPQNQSWYCVEEDIALKVPFWEHARQMAIDLDYAIEQEGELMKLTKPGHEVLIHFVHGNLLKVDELVDLLRTDLVLANAVFDLFSKEQFATLVQVLSHHSLSMLFTLNYVGMDFSPSTEADDHYIGQYNAHMQREQAFGRGMGPASSREMEAVLKEALAQVEVGESLWQIGNQEQVMMGFLLGFFEGALSDWWDDEAEKIALEKWLLEKKQQVAEEALAAEVYHLDILASFFPAIA